MGKPLLILLVATALAGALWWGTNGTQVQRPEVLQPGRVLEQDTPAPPPEAVALEREDPVMVESGEVPVLPFPVEVELRLLAQDGLEVPRDLQAPGSGANASIKGLVTGTNGLGIPATIEFLHGTNAPRKLESDREGRFGASDLWPGIAVVRVTTNSGLVACREVLLRNLAEAKLNLSFSSPAVVVGSVQDLFGKPIQGAEVEIDGNRAYSGPDGRFQLGRIAAGLRIVATAKARGYAAVRELISLERGGLVEDGRFTFRMAVGTTLDVVVPEALGGKEPVQIVVFPASGGRVQQRFPWEWLQPLEVPAGGRLHLEDLPPETITLVPFATGAVPLPPQLNVKLDSGRKNQAVVHLSQGPQITGTLTQDGEPAPNARITLEAPDRSVATTKALGKSAMFHQEALFPHVAPALQAVTSGSRGTFLMSAYPALGDRWYLSARNAEGTHGLDRVIRIPTSGALDLGELELLQLPELEPSAELGMLPAPHLRAFELEVSVQGAPRERTTVRPGETSTIEGLLPGLWKVDARYRGQRLLLGTQVRVSPESPASLELPVPTEATIAPTREELGLGREGAPAGLDSTADPGPVGSGG